MILKKTSLILLFLFILLPVSALDENHLIAWWDFEDTCNETNTKLTLSSESISYNATGKIGKSGIFDGSSECNFTSSTYLTNAIEDDGAFSYSYWIKNQVPNDKSGTMFASADWQHFKIEKQQWGGANNLMRTDAGSKGTRWNWTNQRYFTYNTWTHIVYVNPNTDDGTCGYYVNGVWDGTYSTDSCWNLTSITGSYTAHIGNNYGGTSNFYGELDSLNIWNKTLNDSEVAELYNSEAGISYNDYFDEPEEPENEQNKSSFECELYDVGIEWLVLNCSGYNISKNDTSKYAQAYYHSYSNPVTVDIAMSNVYYPLTNYTISLLNGFHSNDNYSIIVEKKALYDFNFDLSMNGGNGGDYEFELQVNGVPEPMCSAFITFSNADNQPLSFGCYLKLDNGDNLYMAVKDLNAPAQDIDYHQLNFRMSEMK